MSGLVCLDGRFLNKEEALVSVFDHGLLYGDGVFEGLRAYSGRIFKLDEHLDRLYESAHTLMLEVPLTRHAASRMILETLRLSGLADAYLRVIVTRGVGDLGLDPRKCVRPTVIVIADEIALYPESVYERGLRAIAASIRKTGQDMLSPQIKSLNYLNNILARIEANRAGAHEAIMLTREGYVTEGTADNIFIVRRGKLLTPPASLGLLRGITRDTILEVAREMAIPCHERAFTMHDVYAASEVFLTGTAAEVVPVVEVDGRRIGRGEVGEITRRLMRAYRTLVRGTPTLVGAMEP